MKLAEIMGRMMQTANAASAALDALVVNPAKANDPVHIAPTFEALRAALDSNTAATRALIEENDQTQKSLDELQRQLAALVSAP
jgi:hypothetical protein